MRRSVVYIAGPMSGIKQHNFPAFDRARDRWQEAGWVAVSPADLTRRASGSDKPPPGTTYSYRDAMRVDLIELTKCDAIALLPGWENSPGADVEVRVAALIGLEFYDAETLEEIPAPSRVVALPDTVAQALSVARDTFAKKNADYAEDDAWRSNFDSIARQMGFDAVAACDTLIAVKQARLAALRTNGRDPQNEAVVDTYLDRMVYSVIAFALLLDEQRVAALGEVA